MSQQIDGKTYYTVGEIAQLVGKTSATIKRWAAQGKIPQGARLGTNNWRVFSEPEKNLIVKFATQVIRS
jgi:excisionase family DNA binding protein